MIFTDTSSSLSHHGVQGMKWGIRNDETRAKYAGGKQGRSGRTVIDSNGKMVIDRAKDSAMTRRVKRDYNSISDKEFFNKYLTSKKKYAKRVVKSKSGDPFADRRAKMSPKKFKRAVNAETNLATSQKLAKKQSNVSDKRSTTSKALTEALIGKRGNVAYNSLRATGKSKAGSAFTIALFGNEKALNIADTRFKNSKEGIDYKRKLTNKYYE